MSKDEIFKKKLEEDIALMQGELERFRVRGMGFTAEEKDSHDQHVEILELKIDEINYNLNNLSKTNELLRKSIVDGLEKSWIDLQSAFQHAIRTYKPHAGVADPHGDDDGPFPYGGGLSGHHAKKNQSQ
jgi:metal-responsive CopG/Arc/MetJ family transcriptional regulator